MPKHIMIDLETLGVGPFPALLSIGAVIFDPEGSGTRRDFYTRVDWQSCVSDERASVDPKTLAWWMLDAPEAARREVFDVGKYAAKIGDALHEFWRFMIGEVPVCYWSHGLEFDAQILQRYCESTQRTWPFEYYAGRDTRTLFDVVEPIWPAGDTPHHALEDARRQALAVQSCYAKLRAQRSDVAAWSALRAARNEPEPAPKAGAWGCPVPDCVSLPTCQRGPGCIIGLGPGAR